MSLEVILNAGKHDEADSECGGVLEQQVEPGTLPEELTDSIPPALEERIPNEVNQQTDNALKTI